MSFDQLPAELRLMIFRNISTKDIMRCRALNRTYQGLIDDPENERALFEYPVAREIARLKQKVDEIVSYPTVEANLLLDFDQFIAHRGFHQASLETGSFIRNWMPKVLLPRVPGQIRDPQQDLGRFLVRLCAKWLDLYHEKHVRQRPREEVWAHFLKTASRDNNFRDHLYRISDGEVDRWLRKNFDRLWVTPERTLRGIFFNAGPNDLGAGPRRPKWVLTELRETGHLAGNLECKREGNPVGLCSCGLRYAWHTDNSSFSTKFGVPVLPGVTPMIFAYCAGSKRTYQMVKAVCKGAPTSLRERAEILADMYLY